MNSVQKRRVVKTLSIAEKRKLINEVESGTKRKKDIAAEFGIPANTLSTILKDKERILRATQDSRLSSERKRLKSTSYPQLESAMIQWLNRVRALNVSIDGPLIREQAEIFAKQLGLSSFQASSGWLDKFKQRNGILQKVLSGESASVSDETCKEYQNNILPQLLADYNPSDVFNADETGLFFKCLPDKTLAFKKEKCHGGKRSKERITVMVAANMTGTEKLKLLVIGKSKKPRCFAGVKSLPVDYTNNAKAWMTSAVYEDWLLKLNRKFQRENRKVLLFVDNCPAHPKAIQSTKAIRVVFLPPNTTSKVQPMDQGIICNLKHHYRKESMRRVLRHLNDTNKVADINLLDAIHLLHKAWAAVTATTIANCFSKAGFCASGTSTVDETVDAATDVPEEWATFKNIFACDDDFHTFADVDKDLIVAEHPTDREILNSVMSTENDSNGDDDDSEPECSEAPAVPTGNQAVAALGVLRSYVQAQASVGEHVFGALISIESFLDEQVTMKKTQKKISDFLVKV